MDQSNISYKIIKTYSLLTQNESINNFKTKLIRPSYVGSSDLLAEYNQLQQQIIVYVLCIQHFIWIHADNLLLNFEAAPQG